MEIQKCIFVNKLGSWLKIIFIWKQRWSTLRSRAKSRQDQASIWSLEDHGVEFVFSFCKEVWFLHCVCCYTGYTDKFQPKIKDRSGGFSRFIFGILLTNMLCKLSTHSHNTSCWLVIGIAAVWVYLETDTWMKDLLFCNKCKNVSGVFRVNGSRFFWGPNLLGMPAFAC